MKSGPAACPNCDKQQSELMQMSLASYVDYHRCLECGHVWTTLKDSSEVVGHVTRPITRRRNAS
jgi:Zn ribbon nucleic-acid-binding protein